MFEDHLNKYLPPAIVVNSAENSIEECVSVIKSKLSVIGSD